MRATYDGDRLGRAEPILTGIPNGFIHDGGRLEFGPDGSSTSPPARPGSPTLAQDRDSLGGKILRITPEGDPAPGNPDPDSPVWTWGHRNVQGLAFDDAGQLWASEFGQDTFDELNRIEQGRQLRLAGASRATAARPSYTDPQLIWRTDEASPSGLAYADGHLWMAALRGERLWRVAVDGDEGDASPTGFFVGEYGRMRTVARRPRRQAVGDHVQPRRPRRPGRRRRPDPARRALVCVRRRRGPDSGNQCDRDPQHLDDRAHHPGGALVAGDVAEADLTVGVPRPRSRSPRTGPGRCRWQVPSATGPRRQPRPRHPG